MFIKLYHILVLKINNFFRFVSCVGNDLRVVPYGQARVVPYDKLLSWAPLAKELSVGLRIGKAAIISILRQTLRSATSFSKEANGCLLSFNFAVKLTNINSAVIMIADALIIQI